MAFRSSIWSSHPFKAIFATLFLLQAPPRLALIFVQSLVRPLRLLPQWDFKTNFVVGALRMVLQYVLVTRTHRPTHREPSKAQERHSRIEPPADRLFSGVLAASETVKPAPVDAIWYPSPPPQDAAELGQQKIVLHFPGGGFIVSFSYEEGGPDVANTMAKKMKATRTVWAQYRIAETKEARFPAALQDALTFYHHVLSIGVDPKNIILSGDSAGGNVVIALLRYLEHNKAQPEALPLPGGAAIWSPWVHITAHAEQDFDRSEYSKSDIMLGSILQWGAENYRPEGEVPSEVEAYISPLHHPFQLSIPLFIHAGAVEVFCADIKNFAVEMAEVNGNQVLYHETALAPHDLLTSHGILGMTEALGPVVEEACDFLSCRRL